MQAYELLIAACLKASDTCIPSTKKGFNTGWSKVVEPMPNEIWDMDR